jgi:hypothetical protein
MTPLSSGCGDPGSGHSDATHEPLTALIDIWNKDDWNAQLLDFADACIFQTSSYGSVRWKRSILSQIVFTRGGASVAAAQLRIIRLPILKYGIAYLKWGPMWVRKGTNPDPDVYRQVLEALKDEYVHRRKLLLRIIPRQPEMASIITEAGFVEDKSEEPYQTLTIDLSCSLEDLYGNLKGPWRRNLRRALAQPLEVNIGQDEDAFRTFISLYQEMMNRKRLFHHFPIEDYLRIQQELPHSLKPHIMICCFKGEPVAGLVLSVIGDTGLFLLGASGEKGRSLCGSFLLQWKAIELLKRQGIRWYDLYGINPVHNPGVYQFKTGLAGKRFSMVRRLSNFDYFDSGCSSVTVKLGNKLRLLARRWGTLNKNISAR